MNTEALNHLLWQVDPMGTCCNVNEGMEHEYWSLAGSIAERLQRGEDPRHAVTAEFDDSFWEDCLLADHRRPLLEKIVSALQSAAARS